MDIQTALGSFPGGSRIMQSFALMEIAEQELKRAGARCFLALMPPESMVDKADWLYRAHARELCRRSIQGADLRPGTYAEVLCLMSATSLRASLASWAGAVMERCYKKCNGPKGPWTGESMEDWPGQVDEEIERLRKKTAVADRGKEPDAN